MKFNETCLRKSTRGHYTKEPVQFHLKWPWPTDFTFLLDSYYSDSLQNVQNGSCNVIHESLVWVWLNWWLFKWYKMAIDILQETLTITKVSTNNMVGSPCLSYFSTHSNRIPDWKNQQRKGLLWFTVWGYTVHHGEWGGSVSVSGSLVSTCLLSGLTRKQREWEQKQG